MLKDQITLAINQAVKDAGITGSDFSVERPVDQKLGDFSTNVALKADSKNPDEIASQIAGSLSKTSIVERTEVKSGFINIFLKPEVWHGELKEILEKEGSYAESQTGKGEKVNVEFISANPTGPLTV